MSWLLVFASRIRGLFFKRHLECELDEELRAHIEMLTEENLRKGMTPEDARYAARRAFGGVEQTKEVYRVRRGLPVIETVLSDMSYGLRMLRRNPGFTAVVVLSMALGIGANTAIFSLIDAVLLTMLPVQDPQQLMLLHWTSHGWPNGILHSLAAEVDHDKSGRMASTGFSYPTYEQIRARNRVFSNVLAIAANGSQLNVGYEGQHARADGKLVSGTFFSTLGVQPILGRTLSPGDDRAGASPVAVISYGYWERRFGRDPAIVGRKITVNGIPFAIVGVSPPEFYGVQPGRAVEMWLPLYTQPQVEPRWSPEPPEAGTEPVPHPASLFEARDNWWVLIMGRLKPGTSEQRARAELDVILQQSMAADVGATTKPETLPHLDVESGSKGLSDLRNEFSKPLLILMIVVGLVLLIACANVANLLLARATSRQKEIVVRLVVGARRARLIRQLLTESVLLAGLGGLVGLILAFWGADLLVAFMASGNATISLDVRPDPRVLGFTAALSLLTGILFGLSPALRSTRVDLTPSLKHSAGDLRVVTPGQRGLRLGLGRALVVTQVSLSLLLLVGAGLFVRTLMNLENVKTGFNQRDLLLFGTDPTQDGYNGQHLADFYRELMRRLEALPGVRSATMSWNTLIAGGLTIDGVSIQGYTPKPSEKDDQLEAYVNFVGPRFFETMGIPLVFGRSIVTSDAAGAPKVAVVNEKFVHLYLGEGNPTGRRFGFGDKKTSGEIEIVGVAADAKYNDLRKEVPPTVYIPMLQNLKFLGATNFEVRTAGDPMKMASAVRRAVQGLEPRLALDHVKSEAEQIQESLFQERLFARLTSFFGALAAVLACVGIYGIMAFAVTRRTREIGIRMAVGASRAEIAEMVLRETFALVGIGIAIGIVVALLASRLISSLLYGLKSTDLLTIAVAVLLMAAAAALAGYLPARRAMRVDPMVALRYE